MAAGELLADVTVNRRFSGAILGSIVACAWVYSPSLSLLALLGGLALLAERKVWLLIAIVLVASATAVALPGRAGWPETLSLMAWVPLLLPAAFVPGLRRLRRFALGLLLALMGLHLLPVAEALVVPLLLLPAAIPERHDERRLQVVWSGGIFGGTLLLAGYPWLRELPVVGFLDWVGLSVDWTSAAVIVGSVFVIGFLLRWAGGVIPTARSTAGFMGILILGVGIVGGTSPTGVRLLSDSVMSIDSKKGSALFDGFF